MDGGGSIALDPGSSLYVYGNTIYRSGTSLAQNPPSCWSTGYNGAYVAPVIIANNICVNASTDRWNRIGSTAGPQPGPAAYRLGLGSPVIGAGANLTGSPYNLAVGSRDYFNGPVPNLSASGFNMGAQN